MSAAGPKSDSKMELDDSGCVQDEIPSKAEEMEDEDTGPPGPQLLDLSDDVLLYILRYCSPHDLKALGFTCLRLGSLVLERSLWTTVDARGVSTSRARMRWLLQALHTGTRALLLTGHATEARGCRGHVNRTRKEVEDERSGPIDPPNMCGYRTTRQCTAGHPVEPVVEVMDNIEGPYPILRRNGRVQISALHAQLPRQSSCPSWPEDCEWDDPDGEVIQEESSEDTAGCPGPVFTLSAEMIRELRARCPRLTALSLEYCNINCNKINPSNFPPSVKRLSLRGTRCYNPPLDKSYLFKIHDYLPALEYLDLSECAWLEPAALLPLSKLVNLRVLLMRECPAMAEFVAYVSLATRYGFRALKVLDLRGSPVGDSEVSALGWLPELYELHLSAPPPQPAPASPSPHHHYIGDPLPRRPQMDDWEMQIPEYYKLRACPECAPESPDGNAEDIEGQVGILRALGPFNVDVLKRKSLDRNQNEDPSDDHSEHPEDETSNKRKLEEPGREEAGPSKRTKEDDAGNAATQAGDEIRNDENKTKRNDKKPAAETSQPHEGDANSREKLNSNDDSETKKRIKYRIFKNKNLVKDGAGPSNSNDKEPDKGKRDKKDKTPKRRPSAKGYKIKYGTDDDDVDTDEDTQPKKPPNGVSKPTVNDGAGTSKANDQQGKPKKYESELNSKINEVDKDRDRDEAQPGPSHDDERVKIIPNETTEERDEERTTYKYKIDVNDGASTSRYSIRVQVQNEFVRQPPRLARREDAAPEPNAENGEGDGGQQGQDERRVAEEDAEQVPPLVRFRRNQAPIVIQCPPEPRQPEQAEPRQHVLYVNLGQQLHAVYRLLPNQGGGPLAPRVRYPPADHLESSSLVTDSSIRRFGRADGEDFNIVNIGPNGPQFGGRDTSGRPNRSNLRILSATGYRNITNRSLIHLATAAPHLQLVDFTGTAVSDDGVEQFKSLRPDVQVKYSQIREENEE